MRRSNVSLTLILDAGYGERLCTKTNLSEDIAGQVMKCDPPTPVFDDFDTAIDVMKRKEFRKDLFKNECLRLGTLLAETMEDAEGWHDSSRIEPAKAALRRG